MAFFKKMKRLARKTTRVTGINRALPMVRKVSRIPGLKTVARGVPILGTAIAVAEGASLASKMFGGRSSAPALPPPISFGKSSAGPYRAPMAPRGRIGDVFKGPDNRLQFPEFGKGGPQELSNFIADDRYLKTYYRAPKGYVVIDWNGKKVPMLKWAAIKFGFWKPAKKPPISVKQWQCLKKANQTVNKIKTVNKMAKNVANFRPR